MSCSLASAQEQGSITINNANKGHVYKIYKILDVESYSGSGSNINIAYKVASGWDDFVKNGEGKNYLDVDASGYVSWKNETNTDVQAFAKAALQYANKNTIEASGSITADSTTVHFTGLSLGYYLVDSSVGSLCSLDTTTPNAVMNEKNGVPTVKKEVKVQDVYADLNSANIGDTVEFKTTITAQFGAHQYVLHDKMDQGLSFQSSSVKVSYHDKDLTSSDYTLVTSNLEDDCTFHINFSQTFCDTLQNDENIVVTYAATLNANAVIAQKGNINETYLKYGDSHTTNSSTTTTKSFELPVFKYTGKDQGLAGAVFTLSTNSDGSNPYTFTSQGKDNNGKDIYRIDRTSKTSSVTTSNSGWFIIQGLKAGTYYLTETKQPAGYNKLSSPIQIVIDEDGTIRIGEVSVDEVKVENKSGSVLPSTGGQGTTLIYALGILLVLGSGIVLISKRKMK